MNKNELEVRLKWKSICQKKPKSENVCKEKLVRECASTCPSTEGCVHTGCGAATQRTSSDALCDPAKPQKHCAERETGPKSRAPSACSRSPGYEDPDRQSRRDRQTDGRTAGSSRPQAGREDAELSFSGDGAEVAVAPRHECAKAPGLFSLKR
jgi:hypothetical protein